jgi:putative ABC transport system permease protein
MSIRGVDAILARIRSWKRGLRRLSSVEAEMLDEFRNHVDLRARDLVKTRGLTLREAERQAKLEFGHIETHREQALASRGLGMVSPLRISRLDVKLGLRMLTKYPGLSLVSVIGMAVAVAIAAGAFAATQTMMNASLPLPEGDRIVAVQNSRLDDQEGSPEPSAVHDFVQWRADLQSVRDLTAFNDETRNLTTADGVVDVITVARMTASGFRVARVAPVLGRPLLDDDERVGAQPVIVIGYDEWQSRFNGDAGVIGRQVRLGTLLHTIVGVMPEDFRFPVNHQFWMPLTLEPARYERGDGPAITMFGRLAPGVSLEEAQSEIAAIGARASIEWPESHGQLRAQVLPYTYPYSNINNPASVLRFHAIRLAIGLLLVVVAINVSVLVYARTATRMGEIAIRTALGASRRRVVTQLFVEAFVLSGVAAALGLGIAALALARLNEMIQGPSLPFWMVYGLSPSLVLYVIGLALVASVIVGVLPALKVTGRRVQDSLKQITARGSEIQLGRTWTAMIVLQVAIAVAVLPYAIYVAAASLERGTGQERYPAHEIVRSYLALESSSDEPGTAEDQDRFLARAREFLTRVEAEPDIAGVAITRSFPGYEWSADLEVEGGATIDIQYNDFGTGLLALFDVPMLAGRAFVPADEGAGATAVIINESLAKAIGGAAHTVLGRRVRFAANETADGSEAANPWLEVVGVVPNFTQTEGIDPDPDPLLYRPLGLERAVAETNYVHFTMRLRGGPGEQFAGRLRKLAAAVDPGLQVTNTRTAEDMRSESRQAQRYLGIGFAVATLSVLLLSAAGIYAMMSFTVARRRREIGIRAALGAGARQVLTGIFARVGRQLGAGVIGGLIIAFAIDRVAGGVIHRQLPVLLPIVAIIMMLVGLLAALGPARRGLGVQPTEALRGD